MCVCVCVCVCLSLCLCLRLCLCASENVVPRLDAQGQYEEEQLAAAAGGVEQDPLLTGPGAAHRAGDLTQLAGDD